jgi:hypothetical protein
VTAHPAGDTFFPHIDPAIWREVKRCEAPTPAAGPSFAWATYERTGVGEKAAERS